MQVRRIEKKTAEALLEEARREIEKLLKLAAADRKRHKGRVDLEAMEEAIGCSMHEVGGKLLEKLVNADRGYRGTQVECPKVYTTLCLLCQKITPADSEVGGAIEAGAPELIDLITSESRLDQLKLGGGLMWLDAVCRVRHGRDFIDCESHNQQRILDAICDREIAKACPPLNQGVEFFALLRKLTVDGFVTSEIGIRYLQYIGNTFQEEFPGCPPIPGSDDEQYPD